MGANVMDLPAGFKLDDVPEGFHLDDLPSGFKLDQPKEEGGFTTALKESFAGIGNTVDKAGSALASIPAGWTGGPEARDEIFRNMEDRVKTRSEWANPKQLSTTPTNRVLSSLATLPMGLISAGLSPFDVGSNQIKNGEDLTTAAQSAGVSGVGNAVGLVLPGFAQLKAPLQVVFNGLSNTAQQAISDLVISYISKTKKSQEEFAPTWEKAITAFSIGGLAGATHALDQSIKSKPSTKGQPTKLDNLDILDAPVKKSTEVPDLSLESPIRATMRVAEQNKKGLPTAEDFNNRDANVRAVQEEIAANEARQAAEARAASDAESAKGQEFLKAQQMEIDDHPHGDRPAQYGFTDTGGRVDENGIPIRADLSMEAQNLQDPLQRNLWGDELPPKAEQELTNAPGLKIPRGQRGAIDVLSVKETIDRFKRGFASGIDVLNSYKGAFYPKELDFISRQINDPKSRTTAVLMSPDEFHSLAESRTKDWVTGPGSEMKRENIRKYFNSEKGVEQLPQLDITTKNGVAQVTGHEGRHRMDVLKEHGIDLVPVLIRSDTLRWGENPNHPLQIENEFSTRHGLDELTTFPKPLTVPKNQRGGLDFKSISEGFQKAADDTKEFIRGISNVGIHHQTSTEDYLSKNIPGMKDSLAERVTQSDPPAKIIQDSLAPGTSDIPDLGLSTNLQSGPELTAAKYKNNPLLLGAGRIMHEAINKTELQIKQLVRPVHDSFQNLSVSHRVELAQLLKKEMFANKRYTEEQLAGAGFTPKQIDAYKMLRAAQKERLDAANAARAALGKKPITEKEAYLASTFNGDWQFSVLDKEGKPAWFVRTQTKAEAIAAQKYLAKNFGDQLNLKDSKIEIRGDSSKYNASMPRDVMGAYSDMLEHFTDNPQPTAAIKEGMQSFLESKGYTAGGHNKHFMEKINIRGFEGDKPWLSEKENANALLQAQTNYLKSAVQWNNHQEAMAKMKEILSDKSLQDNRPNALNYLRKVEAAQLGLPSNVMAAAERSLASILPAYFKGTVALGRSRSAIYGGVGGLKSALYLQLLGLNIPHMIATPFQALMTVPAQHRVLTTEGFTHNVAKTTMNALSDFTSGMLIHQLHELSGKTMDVPMSAIGKKALTYAEDNGIIEKNIFNENVQLGDSAIGASTQKLLGGTIAFPEKVTRLATFMSFVHHLNESGKFKSDMEVFQRAKELTDRSVTSFRSVDRPMIVNKLGATGNLAYTFKSFLFNEFNQLGQLSRNAARYFESGGKDGAISPLAIHLASIGLVGGMLSVPLVNEMDGMWNLFKDFVAEHAPGQYNIVKGNGLKASIIEHLPDFASYGGASAMLGTALQSRLSMDVIDPEHPFKNMFPLTQDIKEAVTGTAALTDPNKSTVTQAIYTQMPSLIKGQMETHMPIFHGVDRGDGTSTAMNPNRLEQHDSLDHLRTKGDWNQRKYGMTSLAEAKDIQTRYSNTAETKRIGTALDVMGTKIYDAIKRGDDAGKEKWINKYLELNPDRNALAESVTKNVKEENLTPSERELKAQMTVRQLYDFMRLRKTRGQDATQP